MSILQRRKLRPGEVKQLVQSLSPGATWQRTRVCLIAEKGHSVVTLGWRKPSYTDKPHLAGQLPPPPNMSPRNPEAMHLYHRGEPEPASDQGQLPLLPCCWPLSARHQSGRFAPSWSEQVHVETEAPLTPEAHHVLLHNFIFKILFKKVFLRCNLHTITSVRFQCAVQ